MPLGSDEAEPPRKMRGTNLHVKQPVFTFGLLALDLLNLSAPGLAHSSILSAISFQPQYRDVDCNAGAQSKSDRPSLILPGVRDNSLKLKLGSLPLYPSSADRGVKMRYTIHLQTGMAISSGFPLAARRNKRSQKRYSLAKAWNG
jgi:hypothetical protein